MLTCKHFRDGVCKHLLLFIVDQAKCALVNLDLLSIKFYQVNINPYITKV